ncbi:hypothetical protein BJX63DRAFT_424071 [Aspergillus granulosus]|uniref:Zn(2)-C6 fungal-type domain-containing protein n=1 Tax=Aspergillus granulosus TaxID=176169 RepID=A0ABR4H148_9EURO
MSFSPIRWPSKRPRRVRKPIGCKPCRESKLRCDRQMPCASCRRRSLIEECNYHPASPSTSPVLSGPRPSQARDTSQLLSPRPSTSTSSPWPSDNQAASDSHARWDEVLKRPTGQGYNAYQLDLVNAELSWLALLFMICSVTLSSMEENDPIFGQLWDRDNELLDPSIIVVRLRNTAMMCLSQDQFLIRHSLNMLEAILILIYGISHNDGVEQTWVLLGMAVNIAIALRCNIKVERRRRCWAGVLLLHINRVILFRDVNVSSLLGIEPVLPAIANDSDILEDCVLPRSSQPTQTSMMILKLRLFQLSSRICDRLSGEHKMDEYHLVTSDAEIAQEQAQWNATFLLDGQPSFLDTSSYAHWCILQQYAHQLYLLLHGGFCLSRPSVPARTESQLKCITSGAVLLEIHREFCEVPRLRNYRWFVYGMRSFFALHDGVPDSGVDFNNVFDEWIDTVQWLNADSVNLDIPQLMA